MVEGPLLFQITKISKPLPDSDTDICVTEQHFKKRSFIVFNSYNAEIAVYQPWRSNGFPFKIILNVLVSSFASFEYI